MSKNIYILIKTAFARCFNRFPKKRFSIQRVFLKCKYEYIIMYAESWTARFRGVHCCVENDPVEVSLINQFVRDKYTYLLLYFITLLKMHRYLSSLEIKSVYTSYSIQWSRFFKIFNYFSQTKVKHSKTQTNDLV